MANNNHQKRTIATREWEISRKHSVADYRYPVRCRLQFVLVTFNESCRNAKLRGKQFVDVSLYENEQQAGSHEMPLSVARSMYPEVAQAAI